MKKTIMLGAILLIEMVTYAQGTGNSQKKIELHESCYPISISGEQNPLPNVAHKYTHSQTTHSGEEFTWSVQGALSIDGVHTNMEHQGITKKKGTSIEIVWDGESGTGVLRVAPVNPCASLAKQDTGIGEIIVAKRDEPNLPPDMCDGTGFVNPQWKEDLLNSNQINLCNYDDLRVRNRVSAAQGNFGTYLGVLNHQDGRYYKNYKLRMQGMNDPSSASARGYIGQSRVWNGARWVKNHNETSNDFAMMKFENNGAIGFYIGNTGSDLFDNQMNTYRRFLIDNSGRALIHNKLVIGNPTNKDWSSEAAYKLLVDGEIICEGLKVKKSFNWPDYVFGAKHNLMSLEEVKSFIKSENHLPGVPSAKEVNENGIEVSEMLRVQMEKIEELTLYMLQLNEENKKLQLQIDELNSKQQDDGSNY